MLKQKELKEKIVYHKEQMNIYRTVDKINHQNHFKAVIRGGEICVIPVDEREAK